MPKQDTAKTVSFGKKRSRRQQLQAARQSRSVTKASSPEVTSSPSPVPGPSRQSDSPIPAELSSSSTPARQVEHDVVHSASKRKLGYNTEETPVEPPTLLPSTLVDLGAIAPLVTGLLCPKCCTPSLSLVNNKSQNSGLALCLAVRCSCCDKDISSAMTSAKRGLVFDINRRAVAASCASGMGYAGLCNFSEYMNIPSLHHKTYAAHTKTVSDKCGTFSRQILDKAVEKVKDAYPEQAGDVKDIHVSFDGSWHKRGHTSKSGIGLVIERKTGLIVDYEVLTSYCPACATTGKRLEAENVVKHRRWLTAHRSSCKANYEGPSGGMEKEAAIRMWSRSVVQKGLRYISIISDGDAKTVSEIHALDPYPGVKVEKHECVNHVGKRFGTALRNLVSDKSKATPKVTLGGKGHGKLRPEIISQLQRYYSNAIRGNDSVPAMRQAITAIVDHASSTDDDHHHDNCPKGEDSWCFFQKAQARGLPPGSHADNIGTPLTKVVAAHIRPTLERMSSDDLLSRCVLQTTQNANESAHAVIWARCPKHQFATRERLSIAVAVGVAEFNFGSTSCRDFLDVMDFPIGHETMKRGMKRDHTRTFKAQVAATQKARRYRQVKAEAKQRHEQRLIELHGEFYVPGGGD